MNRDAEMNLLNRALRILSRSLLQYAGGVGELLIDDERDRSVAKVVELLCREESNLHLSLAEEIISRHGEPRPGSFNMRYTSHNFIRWSSVLDAMVAELVAHQDELLGIAADLADDSVVADLVRGAAKGRESALAELQGLVAAS